MDYQEQLAAALKLAPNPAASAIITGSIEKLETSSAGDAPVADDAIDEAPSAPSSEPSA